LKETHCRGEVKGGKGSLCYWRGRKKGENEGGESNRGTGNFPGKEEEKRRALGTWRTRENVEEERKKGRTPGRKGKGKTNTEQHRQNGIVTLTATVQTLSRGKRERGDISSWGGKEKTPKGKEEETRSCPKTHSTKRSEPWLLR